MENRSCLRTHEGIKGSLEAFRTTLVPIWVSTRETHMHTEPVQPTGTKHGAKFLLCLIDQDKHVNFEHIYEGIQTKGISPFLFL